MTDSLTEWATAIVDALGYVGVGALVALENLFPPIPSEVVLPLAGFVTARGSASFAGMVLAATLGSLAGALILYGLAAAVGPARFRRFIARYGPWLRLEIVDVERAEQWFDRRASAAVLIGRCVPLIRSLISIPAGFRRMPLPRFIAFTTVGSTVWNIALIGAGNLLGENWEAAGGPVDLLQGLVLLGLGASIAWYLWRRFLLPRLRRP